MDLRDDSRTVVYSGPVVRRTRGETGFLNWTDLTATLLDNYCESFLAVHHLLFSIPPFLIVILTRDVKKGNVTVKQQLMSRVGASLIIFQGIF